MSSKMREALKTAYLCGQRDERCGGDCPDFAVATIAHYYGDLEFTREEVRGIGKELWMQGNRTGKVEHPSYWCEQDVTNALSRHLGEDMEQAAREDARESFESRREALERGFRGESESGDETPTIQASEIERATGEKVPGWARWACRRKGDNNVIFILAHKPTPNELGGWSSSEPSKYRRVRGYEIRGPWQYSLRRIIHDTPEEKPDLLRVVAQQELARGHAEDCEKAMFGARDETGREVKCTCHYDKLRKVMEDV